LQHLFQIQESSILDKEFTMMTYKVCTNTKLTCTHNISKLKKILKFQKYYLLRKSLKAEYIGRLRSLPKFCLDSNLDKECSIVIYIICTISWLTCTS
jgi:hypothetical protein